MYPLGLEIKRINACPNISMLYRNECTNLDKCIRSGISRYKQNDNLEENTKATKNGPRYCGIFQSYKDWNDYYKSKRCKHYYKTYHRSRRDQTLGLPCRSNALPFRHRRDQTPGLPFAPIPPESTTTVVVDGMERIKPYFTSKFDAGADMPKKEAGSGSKQELHQRGWRIVAILDFMTLIPVIFNEYNECLFLIIWSRNQNIRFGLSSDEINLFGNLKSVVTVHGQFLFLYITFHHGYT
ncbi:hypothetical protein LXL04_029977 [Taraxacum kok-saghyz]